MANQNTAPTPPDEERPHSDPEMPPLGEWDKRGGNPYEPPDVPEDIGRTPSRDSTRTSDNGERQRSNLSDEERKELFRRGFPS